MKHRTGHLFRRGKAFYVRWAVEGKVFSKALRDENGKAITTKRDAEEAQRKLMAPFAVADEAAALESIVGKLEGRKAELAQWDEAQTRRCPSPKPGLNFWRRPTGRTVAVKHFINTNASGRVSRIG